MAFVLATTLGFIDEHVARTGDYDALLCFMMTCYSTAFYNYLMTKKSKYLYITWIFIALAVLTKSVAGLLLLPAIGLFAMYKKQLKTILTNPHFYFGIIIFICLVGGYYYFRELATPGYWEKVNENELGGRYLHTLEKNGHDWYYYLSVFKAPFWILFIPFGIYQLTITKEKKIQDLGLYVTIILVMYLIIIAAAQTKLRWYVTPTYIFSPIIIGLGVWYVVTLIKRFIESKSRLKIPSIYLILLISVAPYITGIFTIWQYKNEYDVLEFNISKLIDDGLKGKINISNNYIINPNYDPQVVFMMKLANHQLQSKLQKLDSINQIQHGMIIIASKESVKNEIQQLFDVTVLNQYQHAIQYQIINKK